MISAISGLFFYDLSIWDAGVMRRTKPVWLFINRIRDEGQIHKTQLSLFRVFFEIFHKKQFVFGVF